jgi:hypothetical protein
MKKHLMRLALITKHIMDANKMDALKAHDRLVRHLLEWKGRNALDALDVFKEIKGAIDEYNAKIGLKNAA